MVEIRVAVAKIASFNAAVSGDTLEVIERPNGGFSFILVDGQGTGRGAKTLSHLLTTRTIAMLKDGEEDSHAVQMIHDYLYTYRMGQVAATINILSVDFVHGTLHMTRSNPAPFYVITPGGMQIHNTPTTPIGLDPIVHPVSTDVPVEPYTYLVLFTDGLLRAGQRLEEDLDISNYLAGWRADAGADPHDLTEGLLARALELERHQPDDDMSIVTLAVLPVAARPTPSQPYPTRRLMFQVPFERQPTPEKG